MRPKNNKASKQIGNVGIVSYVVDEIPLIYNGDGDSPTIHTFLNRQTELFFINDSQSTNISDVITITLDNGFTMKLYAGEAINEILNPFRVVQINNPNNLPFRMYGRR